MKVKRILIVVAIALLVPIIGIPLTIYISGVRNCCRDWSRSLADSKAALDRASTPAERFYILSEAAKSAAEVRQYALAQGYATELLRLAPAFRRDWNYGNAIHDGHMVLGRLALAHGDRAVARTELLLAGGTPGSPQLDSFGPNMSLAKDMLAAGERETVFRYFDECSSFWESGRPRIRRWKLLATWRLPADFGPNLLY